MLFLVLSAEKNYSNPHQVKREFDLGMLCYIIPGPFHFRRPVYIIKHKDRFVVNVGQTLLKVPQGAFLPVVSVKKYNIKSGQILECLWQQFIKRTHPQIYMVCAQSVESCLSHLCSFRTTLNCDCLSLLIWHCKIKGADTARGTQFQYVASTKATCDTVH